MIYVNNTLSKEAARLTECLDISTKSALIDILEKELIAKFLPKILHLPKELDEAAIIESEHTEANTIDKTEFDSFITEKRVEDL